jgi:N-acylneuraminate cytidylyltransferase
MSKIAIITARGGSKRIPRKNIKPFLGKPIIAYSIISALESGLFEEVMVSTDDIEIAEIAKKYGAKVPFQRSAENSDDYAGTAEVLLEVIESYQRQNQTFDYACCIYPTAPFITPQSLKEAFKLLSSGGFDSVFPTVQFSYPIQRALKKNQEGRIEMFQPKNLNKRSQDLEPAYHDAGQFYFLKIDTFTTKKKLWTDNSASIVLSPMEVQDIDNQDDWELAELKYQCIQNKK